MSQNPLGKVVDIIIAIIVMFFVPFIWTMSKSEQVENTYARSVIDNFAEKVAINGYISSDDYEQLVSELCRVNRRYDIELCHTATVYEPEYSGGVYTGNVMEYINKTYTDEILRKMGNKGAYLMNIGDSFTISIYQRRVKGVSAFAMMLFKTGSAYQEDTVTIANIFEQGYQSYY